MKKVITLVLVLAFAVSLLTGCGSGGDKVIRVWVGEESVEFYEALCLSLIHI